MIKTMLLSFFCCACFLAIKVRIASYAWTSAYLKKKENFVCLWICFYNLFVISFHLCEKLVHIILLLLHCLNLNLGQTASPYKTAGFGEIYVLTLHSVFNDDYHILRSIDIYNTFRTITNIEQKLIDTNSVAI